MQKQNTTRKHKKRRKINPFRLGLVLGIPLLIIGLALFLLIKGISSLLAPPPAPEPKVTEEVPAEDSVLITATGDILLEQTILDYFGNFSWNSYTAAVSDLIGKDDLTITSLNGSIGSSLGVSGSEGSFNGPDNAASNMKNAGLDFVSLATEHAYDREAEGIASTHALLDQAGLQYTGTAESQEERDTPKIVPVKNMNIGLVSYTFASSVPTEDSYSVNQYEEDVQTLLNDVKTAASQSDAVIVCIHWGDLYATSISNEQKELAQQLADAGAAVIIGNYPGVLEPAQWITSASGKQTLCFYSLGNFISGDAGFEGADETAQNLYQLGAVAQFELVKQNNTVSVRNAKLYPVVNHFQDGFKEFRLIQLKDYTDSLSVLHDQAYYSGSFSKGWLDDQVSTIFTDETISVQR